MRSDTERLADILSAAEAAIAAASPRSRSKAGDAIVVPAVTYQLIVIGEAASHVSTETRAAWPDLPWDLMIGMRNFVVHSYWRVDLERLWKTVERDLPPLVDHLHRLAPQAEDD